MSVRAYSRQAVLLCVALGVALGMVAWALFIHDGTGTTRPSGGPAPVQAPQR